ncbi:S-adenosyl-L-methionine-dependent methyltransferase [Trametopsis cervina]|nr:S-adenosyl-L-methionine-dependent methyltransferase [Trametopsis cervina]
MSDGEDDIINDAEINDAIALGEQLINIILDRQPFELVKAVIDDGAPLWFQDDDGTSALHAAAYVEDEQLVQYLLEKGAIWNTVDNMSHSSGDIALSMNNEGIYTLIRDAGIRSELLLTLLASKDMLSNSPLSLVLKATDTSAAGSTENYLTSSLRFTKDEYGQEICLLKVDEYEEVGVMMGWEQGIMEDTVAKLCLDHENLRTGLKVLNVGFGLGIIDSLFQTLPTKPAQHVIIEAHPDVLQHMRDLGWYEKPGVKILEGKWQDFIESEELLSVGGFDVVYTDTFSEDYKELHNFFGHVPDLLEGPESRFSFFNGLGATNATFYDVYTRVSELHLAEVGLDVEWSDVDVFSDSIHRWGKTREYFGQRHYRLPIGRMRTM